MGRFHPGLITERQRWVWSFMLKFQKTHGMPPTMAEIMAAGEIKSTKTVHEHVTALEKHGYVKAHERNGRKFRVAVVAD